MKRWWIAFATVAVTFLILDAAWITLVAGPQYKAELGHLMAASPNPVGAALFYPLFVAGVVTFGVRPSEDAPSTAQRVALGALFGLIAYATWGLTGNAVLRDFPLSVALLDMAWGAAASAVVTAITVWVLGRLKRS